MLKPPGRASRPLRAHRRTSLGGGARAFLFLRRAALTAMGLAMVFLLAGMNTGCESLLTLPFAQPGASLKLASRTHHHVRLNGEFDHVIYGYKDPDTVTVVLIDGPIRHPAQAATIRLLWRPNAGSTPISPTATNATVQYIVFARGGSGPEGRGEVGVYNGAGFVYPTSKPGGRKLRAGVWQVTLRLTDRSAGFRNLLGRAGLAGDLTARRDDRAVSHLLHRLDVLVARRLGRPHLVAGPPSFNPSGVSDG